MNRGVTVRASVIVLALVLGLLTGLGTAGLILLVTRQQVQPPEPAAGEFRIQVEEFDDARSVPVVISSGVPVSVSVPVAGVLVTTQCSPGAVVESGDTLAEVGADLLHPVVALSTGQPQWRSLTPSSTEAELAPFSDELQRLGVLDASSPADTFDALVELAGLPSTTEQIDPGTFIFLPTPQTRWESCDVPGGVVVSQGQEIGRLSVLPRDVRVELPAGPGVLSGDRLVEIGGVVATTTETGLLDPAALGELVETQDYRRWLESSGAVPLVARWHLRDPVQVAPVPARTVVDDAGSQCVFTDGSSIPVRVVGSRLGRSLIEFLDEEPPTVQDPAPEESPCR